MAVATASLAAVTVALVAAAVGLFALDESVPAWACLSLSLLQSLTLTLMFSSSAAARAASLREGESARA